MLHKAYFKIVSGLVTCALLMGAFLGYAHNGAAHRYPDSYQDSDVADSSLADSSANWPVSKPLPAQHEQSCQICLAVQMLRIGLTSNPMLMPAVHSIEFPKPPNVHTLESAPCAIDSSAPIRSRAPPFNT